MKKIILVFLLFLLSACSENKYDFNLQGLDKNYSLKDFKGENLLIYFGYTLCPDVCPFSLSRASDVLAKLDNKNIKLVFITLDPKRDDVKSVEEYVKFFQENSIGLVPSEEELVKIAKNYGVKYEYVYQDSEALYTVAHSSSLYFINDKGEYKGEISNLTEKNIIKKINSFLNEG
ncbi:SCO family protein [Campylobacter canadensis]|uniref:SCO family protein n=1 Tax=Campylobacter canadensis TaxID=449520 RepID=A0ABS7WR57_9BACT|nr:SCO family protein [Campylobacter canadensis]MBZ7986554.1 SCO family protein [Campylobacter canadensis]MBZ7994041.1 SCO family protein [Campylobacter canadensis]MBZ7995956.1 SCO family protein [Campylobacter canadensis]MBZ7997590.1 SCO family protein [Campylobacter canadensis]MBZ7999372.1 SCO family protein [Campylobacter canadensis]